MQELEFIPVGIYSPKILKMFQEKTTQKAKTVSAVAIRPSINKAPIMLKVLNTLQTTVN
jgi:hypothetical protein